MTITRGDYTATITDDLIVEIRHLDELIDWPGPWATLEAATEWANLRLDDFVNGVG